MAHAKSYLALAAVERNNRGRLGLWLCAFRTVDLVRVRLWGWLVSDQEHFDRKTERAPIAILLLHHNITWIPLTGASFKEHSFAYRKDILALTILI